MLAVLSIAGAITLGAMSPGPSFLLVARTSAARSRGDGLAMALAMGVGGMLFAVLALAGVHVVLSTVPLLYAALKALGGAYLIYLGWRIWRNAARPVDFGSPVESSSRSLFVSLLPKEMPLWAMLVLPVLIFCIEAGWYSIVALALIDDAVR